MVRSPPKAGVSNHEAGIGASSFETRFALLRMRVEPAARAHFIASAGSISFLETKLS